MGPSKAWVPYTLLIAILFRRPGSLRRHTSASPGCSCLQANTRSATKTSSFRGPEPGRLGLWAGHATTWRRSLLPEASVLLDSEQFPKINA